MQDIHDHLAPCIHIIHEKYKIVNRAIMAGQAV